MVTAKPPGRAAVSAPTAPALRRKRGRPTKLTLDVKDVICNGIRKGLTYELAAQLAGVTKTSLMNWKVWGDTQKSGKYFDFLTEVTHAEAEAAQVLIDVVRASAERGSEEAVIEEVRDGDGKLVSRKTTTKRSPRDWRAAMAMLERRMPDSFGKSYVKHEGIPESAPPSTGPVVNMIFRGAPPKYVIEGALVDEAKALPPESVD